MKSIKVLLCCLSIYCSTIAFSQQNQQKVQSTFCNPLDLNYRFELEAPSRREAADPTVIVFKDRYYLFASKSGGYWHSLDLISWSFVETDEIPTEEYAPTVIAIRDTLFFLASSAKKSTIYKSVDPLSGKWSVAKEQLEMAVWDPALFMDEDNRLYLYWGIMNNLKGVELDYKNDFEFIGKPQVLITYNPASYGWEVPGDYNELIEKKPFIEGCWANKYNGKYYLQYAAPGTEYKSYSDAVYISDSPLGPYELQSHNPFSYKPEGFINGAGHGSTFEDEWGNHWHISTMSISVKHQFERRLGLWPAFIDEDGILYAYTAFGDYPHKMPQSKMNSPKDYLLRGMLLSYNKPIEVSSTYKEFSKEKALDENIRTYWSAESGNEGEWIVVDLLDKCTINSIQINFAEEESTILGRKQERLYHQYKLEYSNNKRNWRTMVDKTGNRTDSPHSYVELYKPVSARYIRLTNYHVPDGKFAISDLRVFGKGAGKVPKGETTFNVTRDKADNRKTTISWTKKTDATGYNIRYGTHPDKLYLNYQVYDSETITINSLNSELDYYFTVDAFNENGITEGKQIIKVK